MSRSSGVLPSTSSAAVRDAERLSQCLAAQLRDAIDASGGAIDFSEFMQRALYEPGLGYYVGGREKLGVGGDFLTAPQMGDLFARCLARQCAVVLESVSGGAILEFGAGSGLLCAQMLEALNRTGELPERYQILELSPDLRARQQQTLESRCPELLDRCEWLERLPENFEGIAIANEVLDAMPVERFRVTAGGLEVIQVAWDGESFVETRRRRSPGELEAVAGLALPEGYESEVGVLAEQWIAAIPHWLRRGVVLIVDYGFPRREFYHPERARGTLMCHDRHRTHTDPYRNLGLQDISAHLDFSALAERAVGAGLELLGYTHQAAFLLSLGLLDLVQAESAHSDSRRWALSQETQRLTQTHEMGELFKVLALGLAYPDELAGFAYLDHRARL